MSGSAGFDFNAWQALNQEHTAAVSTEAETPDSVTQGGVDQLVQSFFRLFGVSPDLKGHAAVIPESYVGSGLSLQNAAVLKDRPGGVLASVLRLFTRELPPGLGAGVSWGAFAVAPGEAEHVSDAGELPAAARFSGLPDVTLLASDPADIGLEWLGELRPPATPNKRERDVGIGFAT